MEIKNITTGIDIEEIKRFENKDRLKDKRFFEYIYTESELDYCFSKKNPYPHLAARYCAKEAAVKALYAIGIEKVTYKKIEIVNEKNGAPKLIIKDHPEVNARISLSHSKTNAIANVILFL